MGLVVIVGGLQSSLYSKVKELEEIRHNPNYREGILTKLGIKSGAKLYWEIVLFPIKRLAFVGEGGKLIGES